MSRTTTEPRLLDQVRQLIRIRHYSIRTEETYVQWIRRYIVFHGKRHPRDMGAEELTEFLSDLAIRARVSASTQNQALNAILFLYRDVLQIQLPWLENVQRAKKPQHLPVVLTRNEVRALLTQLEGTPWLMAALIYGSGLRLLECLRLRVKDVEFEPRQITVRDAKGQKDRVTALPLKLIEPLRTIWCESKSCIKEICMRATVACICLSRLQISIRAPIENGLGSTYSLLRADQSIQDPRWSDATIYRKTRSNEP